MEKILVVEDDAQLKYQLRYILGESGFQVETASSTDEGLEKFEDINPDLILLDVMVPTTGGWEMCRVLREKTHSPIILLTALANPEDMIKGLKLGADDYITKPFNTEVLIARISAHLRRYNGYYQGKYVFGDDEIIVDLPAHTILIRGESIEFTPRELSLLIAFVENAGKVMPTEELLAQAWGEAYRDTPENIKPYIHYLRKKIELDPATPKWINTVRGIGYRFGL